VNPTSILNIGNNSLKSLFVSLQKLKSMGAIVIKADKKSNKILADLAKKLGGNVLNMADDQYEDFAIGSAMDSVKTGETVDRDTIFKKLKSK
jgi:hypothetical protein